MAEKWCPFKEATQVEVFKAQRLFAGFCSDGMLISTQKWEELLKLASLSSEGDFYDYHRNFLGYACDLTRFITACRIGFPLDEAWQRLKGRVFREEGILKSEEPSYGGIDQVNSEMEQGQARVHDMPRAELFKLLKGGSVAERCLASIRLASLQLGGQLEVRAALNWTPARLLRSARKHLRYALRYNPAWWEAHAWLAVAQWRSGEREAAMMSARRSLMLDRMQGRMWGMLGTMASWCGDGYYAINAWMNGFSLQDFESAVRVGLSYYQGRNAAAALKLAVNAAKSRSDREMAESLLEEMVAKNPSFADVEPLRTSARLNPEKDFNSFKVGCRIFF